jgi:hypothetical protein
MGKSNKMSRVGLKKNRPKRITKLIKKVKPTKSREALSLKELNLSTGKNLEEQMQNLELQKNKQKEEILKERDQKVQEFISTVGVKNQETLQKSINKAKTVRLSKGQKRRLVKKQKVLKKKAVPSKVVVEEETKMMADDPIVAPKSKNKSKKSSKVEQNARNVDLLKDIELFQSINSLKSFQDHPLSSIKEHITSAMLLKDKLESNQKFLTNFRENIMNALPNI